MKRLLVASFVMLVAVSGCSDDPKPKFAEPEETPSSATPSASESPIEPSASPTAAGNLDPVETVTGWIEARNEALSTGDTALARELSAPGCDTCFNYLEAIEQVYEAGGRFETKGWTILASKIRTSSPDAVTVDAGFQLAGGRTFPEAGAQPVVFEPEKRLMTFRLRMDDGRWLIRLIALIR